MRILKTISEKLGVGRPSKKDTEIAKVVLEEVRNYQAAVNVLLANKNPDLKRRMGIRGDYAEHRDGATKAILDNAFHLAILIQLMNDRPLLRRRFQKTIDKVNAYANQTLSKPGVPGAIPTLTPAPAEEPVGIPFVKAADPEHKE